MATPQISLAEAARLLAWPYRKTYDAYLDGRLDGTRDATGHYLISRKSVNALLAQRDQPTRAA